MMKVALLVGSSLLGVGGLAWFKGHPNTAAKPQTVLSQSGRDMALVQAIRDAKKSIFVRTQGFALVPVANELLQAQQRGVAVRLELPPPPRDISEGRLVEILADHGAIFQFGPGPIQSFEGTLVVIDDHETSQQWLYSAAPLTYVVPGTARSYVRGQGRFS